MDKPPPDDFDPYNRGDMNITEKIPQSTLIVAGALWTVLFGLMVWLLISVNQQGGDIKVIASQQSGYAKEIARIDANLDRIETHNREQDKAINLLEARR